jgi:hemerythrin
MSQITWNDSYSVNNPVMDAQHKEWIAIYNKLDHILLNDNYHEIFTAAASTLQAMQKYADYHFLAEEEYMRQIQYPDLVAHKRLHTDFNDQLFTYNKNIRDGETILNSEIMSILKNWLSDHILNEDKKYCTYLTQK